MRVRGKTQHKGQPMAVSSFNQHAAGYSLEQAYWFGQAVRLAYRDESEMPFLLEDTQAYLAASDHMILVAFRGTEPPKIRNWLSDSNTPWFSAPPERA
jgi:triacylglycerol lipase